MRAGGRTGEDNFVTCMRKALAKKYEDNPVGMGGVFQILSGKAKLHVMVRSPGQMCAMVALVLLDWIGTLILAMRLLFQAPRTHTHTHIHIHITQSICFVNQSISL